MTGWKRATRLSVLTPALIAVVAFALYYSLMSCSLDEWDAAQFALALTRYDVTSHQPHPPGYPVYVFLGWIIYRITGDQVYSLTLLSALSGALTLLPFYLLVQRMFGNRTLSAASSLLLMVLPQFWLNSIKAISDVPAVLFATSSLYLFYRYAQSGKRVDLLLGALILGLGIGIRITNLAILGVMLLTVAWRRDIRGAVTSLATTTICCLAWFLPMIALSTGGWEGYAYTSMRLWSTALIGADSLFRETITLSTLWWRTVRYAEVQLEWGLLANMRDPQSAVNLILFSGLFLFGLSRLDPRRRNPAFIIVWAVPYAVFMLFFLNLWGVERYALPLMPPLALSIVKAADLLPRGLFGTPNLTRSRAARWLRWTPLLALTLLLGVETLPLAQIVHTQPAPVVQLVYFVKENYNPGRVAIVVKEEYRKFQFYAPEYRVYGYIPLQPVPPAEPVLNSIYQANNPTYEGRTVLITGTALQFWHYRYPMAHPVLIRSFKRNRLAGAYDHEARLYRWA
jgi:4-amino-4-deoxy-L-arabinose transferase-like glycosyltransferase